MSQTFYRHTFHSRSGAALFFFSLFPRNVSRVGGEGFLRLSAANAKRRRQTQLAGASQSNPLLTKLSFITLTNAVSFGSSSCIST
jgi:hypothetical protein